MNKWYFDAVLGADARTVKGCRGGFSQHEGMFFPRYAFERFDAFARGTVDPETNATVFERILAQNTGAYSGQAAEEVLLQTFVANRLAAELDAARPPVFAGPACAHWPPRSGVVGALDAVAYRLGRNLTLWRRARARAGAARPARVAARFEFRGALAKPARRSPAAAPLSRNPRPWNHRRRGGVWRERAARCDRAARRRSAERRRATGCQHAAAETGRAAAAAGPCPHSSRRSRGAGATGHRRWSSPLEREPRSSPRSRTAGCRLFCIPAPTAGLARMDTSCLEHQVEEHF